LFIRLSTLDEFVSVLKLC